MNTGKGVLLKTIFFFFLISKVTFSQKKAIEKFTSNSKEIFISTDGLDDLVIENSASEFIEVFLFAENPNKQHILIEQKITKIDIKFRIPIFKNEEAVFRKYITKRLKRAAVTIKIPKNKQVSVLGEHINITSKSYKGDLRIYIEKGIVKLDAIQQNATLKMYGGTVFATLKSTNLAIVSKVGKIKIDSVFYEKEYQETETRTAKKIVITTIKGNIFLRRQ